MKVIKDEKKTMEDGSLHMGQINEEREREQEDRRIKAAFELCANVSVSFGETTL